MQPMGGCRLLYSVKSKKWKNFAVLLCFYVNTFNLLYFLRLLEGVGLQPPSHPPKSATETNVVIVSYSNKFMI